jgi:hypothetical protein
MTGSGGICTVGDKSDTAFVFVVAVFDASRGVALQRVGYSIVDRFHPVSLSDKSFVDAR